MYNFIFFTDAQANSHAISSRKDVFEESIIHKMEDLVEAANARGCDVYCGGDFIDTPYVGHSFIVRLISTLKKLKGTMRLVLGNHDILGRNIESYKYTTIGILEKAGALTVFARDTFVKADNYSIVPIHYNEDDCLANYAFTTPTIAISHNMILPMSAPFNHIKCEDLEKGVTVPTYILCGHYHPPFRYVSSKVPLTVINPGSTGRVSRGDGQDRVPEFLACTVEGMNFTYEYHKFKSAKPWSDVFYDKEESPFGVLDIKVGIESLSIDGESVTDIVRRYGNAVGADAAVIDESLRRVQLLENSINSTKNRYGQ
jgi:calcineurin-like phosphoesterase family protein